MIIWITGLSGAGKTTLCNAMAKVLKPRMPHLAIVDGDVIRALFGSDLDYTEASRVIQIKRIQSVAKFLDDQGFIVLVAALYAHPDLLDWNRRNFRNYFEIYLDASLELVAGRDSKGLYAAARNGEDKNVVGMDIPWHAPVVSDLRLECPGAGTPERMAATVIDRVPLLRAAMSGASHG